MPGEVRDEQAFAAGTLQQRSIHIDEDDAQLPNLLRLPVSAEYPLRDDELDNDGQSADEAHEDRGVNQRRGDRRDRSGPCRPPRRIESLPRLEQQDTTEGERKSVM